MASLVLGVAGAAVGSAFGPFGASVGWTIGAAVGGALFGEAQKQEGPRLTDLKVQGGDYGSMTPLVWGTHRLAGVVIWATDLVEHKHTETVGGKGGGSGGVEVTSYTYTCSWAVRVCEGPDVNIVRIWADSRVVYDANKGIDEIPFTWYIGSETQLPDPTMEAELGAGNVNANRGIAYAVWADTDLGPFGNRLPNLTFEVTRAPAEPGIFEIKFRNDLPFRFGGSDSFYNHGDIPRITSWPMYGDANIEVAITSGVAYVGYFGHQGTAVFDRQTLDVISAAIGAPVTFSYTEQATGPAALSGYDTIYTAPEYSYAFVGIFNSRPLWIGEHMATHGGIAPYGFEDGFGVIAPDRPYWKTEPVPFSYPPVNGSYPYSGGDLTLAWGIPNGVLIAGAALSQDGLCLLLLVCDSPTSSGIDYGDTITSNGVPGVMGAMLPNWSGAANVWYKIHGGSIVDSGTIDPPISSLGFGNSGGGGYNAFSMENNYRWIWAVPTTDNLVRIYHIDDAGNLALDNTTMVAATTYWANEPGYNFDRTSGTYVNSGEHGDRVGIPTTASDATPSGFAGPADITGSPYISILCTEAEGYCGLVATTHIQLLRRISQDTAGVLLSEIVADVSDRVGLESSQYDVSELTDIVHGYQVAAQSTGRTLIETLQPAYYFDAAESDAQIQFKKRGRAVSMTIADADLGAAEDGSATPALIKRVRAQESDLPQRVDVVYIDHEADYQTGTQESQRMVGGSVNAITINIPVAIDSAKGKQIADAQLFSAWLARDTGSISLTRKYAALDPADVVVVKSRTMRIIEKRERANNVIDLTLVADHPQVWTQAAVPAARKGFTPQEPQRPQATDLLLLDIPYVTDINRQQVYYAAMAGHDRSDWKGAVLYKSVDSGTTYDQLAVDAAAPDAMGTASTVLGDFTGGNVFDEMNAVTVVIGAGGGTLESVTREAVLNGKNEFLLGDEIIRAKYCTLTATSTYMLSGLLRGRHGTEWATGTHASGERFVVLPVATTIDAVFGEYNASRKYKAVTVGSDITTATAQDFSNSGRILQPYAPVQLRGGYNAAGDVTLTWRRRARLENVWLEGVEVPLGEEEEGYRIRLYSDGTYATSLWEENDTAAVLTGMWGGPRQITFTTGDLATIYGSPPATVYWGIAQRGKLGAGYEARAAT